jgi:Secretion system C-terminal sorting domain
MKKNNHFVLSLLTIVILLFSHTISAQCTNWEWAKMATDSGTGGAEGYSTCTDTSGNIYITGFYFSPTITFGSFTLTNTGINNAYVVKYDPLGNVLWAKSSDGSNSNIGYSISADNFGNIYLTGFSDSPSITFGSYTLTNAGYFIVKYNSSTGNVIWVKSAGAAGEVFGYSVSTDLYGNIYASGSFGCPSVIFGSFTLTNSDATLGTTDVFIAKYDSLGNVLWAKSAGGTGLNEEGMSVSSDGLGNAYMTGYFTSPIINFGGINLNNSDSGYNCDVFLVKYNSLGNVIWAESIGQDSTEEVAWSIKTDVVGNIFLTGNFNSPTFTVGSFTLTNINNSGVTSDMFIAKYNSSGAVLWAKSGGGNSNDYGYSVCPDRFGNVYLSGGFFSSSFILDSDTLTPVLPNLDDMFIVNYDSIGNINCASYLNCGGDDQSSVSVDKFGNAYFTGDILTNPSIIGTDTLYPTSAENIFLAKIKNDSNVEITEVEKTNAINVFPNPSNGQFNFIGFKKGSAIEIYDIAGRLIYMLVSKNETQTIDLSDKDKGIYLYRIISVDRDVRQGKIILQ